MYLVDELDLHAVVLDDLRGPAGRVEVEAEVVVSLRGLADLGFVAVADGDEYAAGLLERVASRDKPLVESFLTCGRESEHLTGGLHLRSEVVVDVHELFKGEYRNLDRDVRRGLVKTGAISHVGKLFAEHTSCREIDHRHAGDFAYIRNRSRGARVDLYYIELILVDAVLDIDETGDLQRYREILRAVDDILAQAVIDIPGRIHRDRVSGVDTCALDVFHDARDEDVLAVAYCVDLELDAHEVFVDEDGVLDVVREDYRHVLLDIVVGEGDDHILTAEHVGRTHEHGITDAVSDLESLLGRHDRVALGALDVMQLEELVKALAILRRVDRVGACAEDVDAVLAHELRELYSGLTAESDDDAEGLLGLDDVHHILVRQRLEIEPVCGVEVGRDRLRVVVDDDDVISGFLERPDTVYRRVVELDTLTDSDRSGAEDYDCLLSVLVLVDELRGFVLVVVG